MLRTNRGSGTLHPSFFFTQVLIVGYRPTSIIRCNKVNIVCNMLVNLHFVKSWTLPDCSSMHLCLNIISFEESVYSFKRKFNVLVSEVDKTVYFYINLNYLSINSLAIFNMYLKDIFPFFQMYWSCDKWGSILIRIYIY